MDPATEIRETKRKKEYINMLANVADSETGIPTRCPCGGRIIHEVRGKDDYDTLPGKRFFTCKNNEVIHRLFSLYFLSFCFFVDTSINRECDCFFWLLPRLMGCIIVSLGSLAWRSISNASLGVWRRWRC